MTCLSPCCLGCAGFCWAAPPLADVDLNENETYRIRFLIEGL